MGNINPTTLIDIFFKPGIVENVYIGASCSPDEIKIYTKIFQELHDVFMWSYEEMLGIYPSIFMHKIPTYLNSKPVRQGIHPIHPRQPTALKGEVEKLLKAGFIYPIALTNWVSNIFLVTKKQWTIWVFVDFHDINRACPKVNYPPPFIDQIIDECAESDIFSFVDGFFGYNQIKISPVDQHKTMFICPWEPLPTKISLLA